MSDPTLRERAAIAAMQGIIASSLLTNLQPSLAAKDAVTMADALVEELARTHKAEPREKFAPTTQFTKDDEIVLDGLQHYDELVRSTLKAHLFNIGDVGYWVPKKQVDALDEKGKTVVIKKGFHTNPVKIQD